ncbi:MAG: helix-turn-helix transcriptional regulator [Solirubrobacteraceae bacterium]
MTASPDARLLDMIGDVLGLLELGELREGLLIALDRAVPSDFVSINEIGPRPADMYSVIRPALPAQLHDVWAEHGHENPLIERFARTQDTRPYRLSDVVSSAKLHSLALYREFYAELGVEYQIAFVVKVSPPLYVGIALSRRERDFSDEERDLLEQARPYVIQVYRAALAHTALAAQLRVREPTGPRVERLVERGLTAREAAVLAYVARGLSNTDIAAELRVSERTVGKHLQRCYRKLEATNRSHAAAIAWGPAKGS